MLRDLEVMGRLMVLRLEYFIFLTKAAAGIDCIRYEEGAYFGIVTV